MCNICVCVISETICYYSQKFYFIYISSSMWGIIFLLTKMKISADIVTTVKEKQKYKIRSKLTSFRRK